jgi:hypothetical protein
MPIPAPPTDDVSAFNTGLAVAEADGNEQQAVANIREKALVDAWFQRIDESRDHDKGAYSQLAKDRSYARGDSIFDVKVNVIGSYIDTWVALLYARNPDIDAMPADRVGSEGLEDARLFGKTAMIIISKQWKKARLKAQAKVWVRAALTSKVGWLKCTWQDRTAWDPTTARAINDLQDSINLIESKKRTLAEDDPSVGSLDVQREELRLAIEGLQEQSEPRTIRGLAIDPVDMADMTVSMDCPSIERYLESPWISHRSYMRLSEAKATYTRITEEQWKKASNYSQRKPYASTQAKSGTLETFNADDANAYIASEVASQGKGGFVCIEEVWDRDTAKIITIARGVERYLCDPYSPDPGTSRFYGFFALTFTEVDGQRWAQSLNERSQSLQDAYDRAYGAFETARRRIKPKTMVNATAMSAAELKKVNNAEAQEYVAVKPTNPKQDMRQLFLPITYQQLDPAVYDTRIIMEKFELVWGLQEAMSGTIDVAKTATESEIQQGGTQARTTNKRDVVEDTLSDLANYIFEIDVQKIDAEEARKYAGIEALWPVGLTPEDFDQLATIQVRAGSSGKPNARAMRETWAAVMEPLMGLTEKIAQLRMSNPLDYANCLEEFVTETLARSGENIDEARFIPLPGKPLTLVDPNTLQPVLAYPAPQQPGMPGGEAAPAPGLPPPPPGGPSADPAASIPDGGAV